MPKPMIPSYIGITDFTIKTEVELMLESLKKVSGTLPIRKLGVGVMASRKTLNGLSSRFSDVFPDKEKIAEIFIADSLVYNVLHYADYEGIEVLDNLIKVVEFSGVNLQAIQLDMIWPKPDDLLQFKMLYPDISLIIQINSHALNLVDCDPLKLISKLQEYDESVISGVLLDMSMGRGLPMSWFKLLPYLAMINNVYPNIQLIVAGGLGPHSLDLVEPLIKCFKPEISIDAQGKLRPSGSYLQPIDWQLAEQYLVLAMKMFQVNRSLYEI